MDILRESNIIYFLFKYICSENYSTFVVLNIDKEYMNSRVVLKVFLRPHFNICAKFTCIQHCK